MRQVLFAALVVGCAGAYASVTAGCDRPPTRTAGPATAASAVTISIVGTNDVHGALGRLPIFAGFVNNLRAVREPAGGGVMLIDAGDMFQGTLESNHNEGAAMIAAYNALGYAAAAIGNHEFDFGPAGPRPTPQGPGDDPRGALKARVAEARFPLLAGNLLDARTGSRVDWKGAPASVLHTVAGVAVGIVGVTTEDTPRTTMAANFAGLAVEPPAEAIAREARELRRRGAAIVVVTAHEGGKCEAFDDPDDLASCDPQQAIMRIARSLPAGAVDVIVAGHTHRAMAHRVEGIAIIESYSRAQAFGRVDVTWDRAAGRVTDVRIFPPHELCPGPGDERVAVADCRPGTYEGAPVVVDADIADVIAPALAAAEARKRAPLGVTASTPITRAYDQESPLGNLFADLMRAARPGENERSPDHLAVAITNGGGLRADLPAGPLTYGDLYEASPFDNRFATVAMRGADLAALLVQNLRRDDGILSLSGVRARARCSGDALFVDLQRDDGKPVAAGEPVTVVTSDFLASGGSGFLDGLELESDAVTLHDGGTIRDAMADALRRRGGTLSGEDPRLLDPASPRLGYPGTRPVSCSRPRAK